MYIGNNQSKMVSLTLIQNAINLHIFPSNTGRQIPLTIWIVFFEFYFCSASLCSSSPPHAHTPTIACLSLLSVPGLGICMYIHECMFTPSWLYLCVYSFLFILKYCFLDSVLSWLLYKFLLLMFLLRVFTNRMQYSSILPDTHQIRRLIIHFCIFNLPQRKRKDVWF